MTPTQVHPIVLPTRPLVPPPVAEGSLFFVGTATTLIRWAGITVLTDPNFLHRGERVHLGFGLHSTRRTEPALSIDELPPIDVVLLSHMHEDHFDRVAAERLDHRLPIVTTAHAMAVLQHKGFSEAQALPTWRSLDVEKGDAHVRITSLPARHGGRLSSKLLPETMGSLLDFEAGGRRFRMYVSGDTLVFDQLRQIPRRFPDIDLALLHLGGTRVLGVLVTMDDAQGVEALGIIRPRKAIPIHYDDYDVFKSPLDDFKRAVERAGLEGRVHYLERGETYRFAPSPQPTEPVPLPLH